VTDTERRLEAPHRRGGASPRIVERSAVLGYRFASWLLRTLPPGPTAVVLGLGSQASYLLWPTKRAWSNRNFGHVLGLPPDDPRVRRLALREDPADVAGAHRQADRVVRPLERRRAMIARPARVRMRLRKPCFLARRRLFGW
jgi:hypothetical protein